MDAARAMLETGDWLVPLYEGQPFFDKPILAYWLMAASMTLFGPTPAAARLVAVVAAVAVVAVTAWLGTLLYDRRSALYGAGLLATTLAFLSFARVAMSDMLLTVFTTAATALGVLAYRRPAPRAAVPALGVVLGLGFATKGPIALLVPGLAILLLLARERRLPARLPALALGAAASCVLGLGWFALVYARLGSGPLEYFFLRENLARFAGETYDVNRPLWFFLPVYLSQGLPWSLFLPIALWRLLRTRDEQPVARWLIAWVALLLVPLSLSRGKLDYYLLPAYPALCLLVGRYFAAWPFARLDTRWARAVLLTAGGLAAVAAVGLLRPPQLPAEWLPAQADALLVLVPTLAAVALLAAAWRFTPARLAAALGGASALVYALSALVLVPSFTAAQPNRRIAADVERERQYVPQARFVYCDDPSHARRDVLFHARHAGVEECDVWSLAAGREPYLFLLNAAQDASFRVLPTYRQVASYRAVPARALTLPGLLAGLEPQELVLVANYRTSDPVAERKRKREYRQALRREWETSARAGE